LISPGIDKVYVEISNVSIEEISKLWGNIGTSYIPSIAYKIKQVKFDGNMISEIIPNIGDKNA